MQHIEETDEKEELDEYIEDEEFIEEDYEESGERRSRGPTGRTVTLQMLLSSGILQPGEGLMTIEYLGQRFIGDLLPDGKIKSQETDIIFASPSAWAINCKRIINPEKKSGCGWASIKYSGRKLDAYKNAYFKKKKQEITKENHVSEDEEMEKEKITPPSPAPIIIQRVVHKHNILGNRSPAHEGNTLIECSSFPSMGKIQPFLVTLTSNAAIVLDLHCHLTSSEVVGYLAGHWDVNAHNVHITHAFPCRTRTTDREMAPLVEADVRRAIEQRQLTLVGWYHSHPLAPATPTLRDIDMQLDHQLKMKGSNDASYTPCVAFICSPYISNSPILDSSMTCYWVMPPPESRPHEYGRPMHMNFNIMQDNFLSQDSLTEIKKCVDFYKTQHDFIKFSEKFKENVTYIEKLKTSLHNKFPRDQGDGVLWGFICEMVCPGINPNSVVISEPSLPPPATSTSISSPLSVSSSHPVTSCPSSSHVNLLVPNLSYTTSVLKAPAVASTSSASMLMPSDIANALFAATGRFPSGSLADPARSALTSMFLPPLSGYKLDPLSMLKPMPSTSKSSTPSDSTSEKNCTVTSGQAL